jgi:hypothetical protein
LAGTYEIRDPIHGFIIINSTFAERYSPKKLNATEVHGFLTHLRRVQIQHGVCVRRGRGQRHQARIPIMTYVSERFTAMG